MPHQQESHFHGTVVVCKLVPDAAQSSYKQVTSFCCCALAIRIGIVEGGKRNELVAQGTIVCAIASTLLPQLPHCINAQEKLLIYKCVCVCVGGNSAQTQPQLSLVTTAAGQSFWSHLSLPICSCCHACLFIRIVGTLYPFLLSFDVGIGPFSPPCRV